VDSADLRALNETFATIERGINNLNAKLNATMAFVAALPGADRVDVEEVLRREAALRVEPVLSPRDTSPEDFARNAVRELHRLSVLIADSNSVLSAANERGAPPFRPTREL
jgi:hypothetical protein